MQEFAQELVDLVIDEVADVGLTTKDIGACGRVCRRWLTRSRVYLFSHICICLSRADPAPFQPFLGLVDASIVPLLSFVHSLEVRLLEGEVSEEHIERLCKSGINSYSRDYPEGPIEKENRRRFQHQMLTHIPRFGASLTHFELGFPSDLEIHVIVELICALPSLTQLKIYGGHYAIIQSEAVPMMAAFPPHLHNLDISLEGGGTGFFFERVLLHSEPPIFTSLRIAGNARGTSIAPIEAYLQRFGCAIKTLTLGYRADVLADTNALRMHAVASTPWLVNLSLIGEFPTTIPTTLALVASIYLTSLEISLGPKVFGVPDWLRIDEILAERFGSLRRVLVTRGGDPAKASLAPEIRLLLPQASAGEILV